MFRLLKKALFRKKQERETKERSSGRIKARVARTMDTAASLVKEFCDELLGMREKMKDLLGTNMKLAFRHLEKGNLSDAIFRFRFVKFFWPNHFDAHYYLAYCLVLNRKPYRARRILENLLEKSPTDNRSRELLEKINSSADEK